MLLYGVNFCERLYLVDERVKICYNLFILKQDVLKSVSKGAPFETL